MTILTIKLFLLTWFFTNYRPIQANLDRFFVHISEKYGDNLIVHSIAEALGCHKCLSFIVVLVFTFNIYFAIAASLISTLIKRD